MRELNPDFALQSRLSFGRGARHAWVLAACAVLLGFADWDDLATPAEALARAGAFLLLGAFPYGAINVRGLDTGGRLDARRLTGRSAGALALALVGGSAWALLLCGAVLLLAGFAGGVSFPVITLAALLAMGVTMALVLLLLPSSTQVDSWLLLLLVALGVVSTVRVMGADRAVTLGVLIVSGLICPWALPLALRRMRSAVPKPGRPPLSVMRLVVRLERAAHPEMARGLLSAGQSFSTAPMMALAGTLSIWWLTRNVDPKGRDIFEVLAVYGPLVLAGYDTAARVRREQQNGGLDRIRLSGQAPWRVVADTAFAAALPFVAVSIVSAAALVWFDPVNAHDMLARWPISAGILIFGPLLGALRGRKPGLYIAASFLFAVVLGSNGTPWTAGLLAVIAAAGLATANLELARRTAPPAWLAASSAAIVAAVVASLPAPVGGGGVQIAALMTMGAVLTLPDRIRVPGRTIAAAAAATAVAAGIAEYHWADGRISFQVTAHYFTRGTFYYLDDDAGRGLYAVLAGTYAGLGLVFGCCVANQFRDRPWASRALKAAPIVGWIAVLWAMSSWSMHMANKTFMRTYRLNGFAILEVVVLAMLAAAVGVLVWREIRETRRRP